MKNITYLMILLMVRCAPQAYVFTDSDKDFDPRLFTTFSWTEVKNMEGQNNPLYYNELNDKRIKSAVDQQLSTKGYHKVDSASDLVVHYHIVVTHYTAYREDPFLHHNAIWMRPDISHYEYPEGTLIVDLMEPKTNSLIWRGYASGIIDNSKPELDERRVGDAIRKMFGDFPGSFNL